MKNVLPIIVVLLSVLIGGRAVAQDRAELLSQVSAIAGLTTANTDNIAKLDDRTGNLERAVFGVTETFVEKVPYTAYREVTKTRTIPPLLFTPVASLQSPVRAVAKTVSTPRYSRTVERSYSAPIVQQATKVTTVRRQIRRPFFSRASARRCAGGT